MGITAAVGVGALASGISGAVGSQAASGQQQKGYQQAEQTLGQYYGQASQNLQPFIQGGTSAYNNLLSMTGNGPGGTGTGPLTAQFQPTMAQLSATPGYQFTLGQGLKATQNGNAAQGLGNSGQALAGAANYAEGLAGTTYQQQFQNYLGQNQQIYNMLSGVAGTGANAANSLSSMGLQAAGAIGGAQVGGGNAAAAGTLGTTNALGNMASSLGTNYSQLQLLQAQYPNLFNGGGTAMPTSAPAGFGSPTGPY